MPAGNPYTAEPGKPLTVSFRLSKPATVEAFIKNENDVTVLTLAPGDFPAGVNQLTWNGRNESGDLVYPGTFRMGIKAIDAFGNESKTEYAVFRVFY
jgi:flagellar hook assembly protein FlgD